METKKIMVVRTIHIAGNDVNEPAARNIPVLKAQSKPETQPMAEASLIFMEFFMLHLPCSIFIII